MLVVANQAPRGDASLLSADLDAFLDAAGARGMDPRRTCVTACSIVFGVWRSCPAYRSLIRSMVRKLADDVGARGPADPTMPPRGD